MTVGSILQRARDIGVDHYAVLPSPLQDAMCSIYGAQERVRRRGRLVEARHRMMEIEDLHHDVEAAKELVERRLGRILAAARQTKGSRERAPGVNGFSALEELKLWPVLTKQEIADDPQAFLTRETTASDIPTLTSGTTGIPLRIWRPRKTFRELFRSSDVGKGWFGVRPDARRASFTGKSVVPLESERVWRINIPGRQLVLSQYHLSPNTVGAYARALARWRPTLLDGYTSNLVSLAELLRASELTVSVPLVVTTCEVLTDAGRRLLQDAFEGAVCDKYGTSENAVLATECPAGSRHVFQNVGILEVVDDDSKPVPDGRPGRLLLTSLTNDLMPLVRYEVGDVGAVVRSSSCPCGRTSPILTHILGREDDVIVSEDGRRIGIFAFQLLRGVTDVLAMQLEQASPTTFVVRGRLRRQDQGSRARFESAILLAFDKLLGDVTRLTVTFEYPEELERTPGGKIRNVIRTF
jgi:phenylacetate-CoA ligase